MRPNILVLHLWAQQDGSGRKAQQVWRSTGFALKGLGEANSVTVWVSPKASPENNVPLVVMLDVASRPLCKTQVSSIVLPAVRVQTVNFPGWWCNNKMALIWEGVVWVSQEDWMLRGSSSCLFCSGLGNACIGLRPHAPRVRECCSHDIPLGSQLQLHLHEELSLSWKIYFIDF